MNENHPIWGDNIQMAEKKMKLVAEQNDKIILRGFGTDAMGASFADYGLTLHKSNNNVNKVTLHMHDRNIDIVYEKAENKKLSETLNQFSDFDNFKNFTHKWNTSMPMQEKLQIGKQPSNNSSFVHGLL
jgi:ribonuclease HIII